MRSIPPQEAASITFSPSLRVILATPDNELAQMMRLPDDAIIDPVEIGDTQDPRVLIGEAIHEHARTLGLAEDRPIRARMLREDVRRHSRPSIIRRWGTAIALSAGLGIGVGNSAFDTASDHTTADPSILPGDGRGVPGGQIFSGLPDSHTSETRTNSYTYEEPVVPEYSNTVTTYQSLDRLTEEPTRRYIYETYAESLLQTYLEEEPADSTEPILLTLNVHPAPSGGLADEATEAYLREQAILRGELDLELLTDVITVVAERHGVASRVFPVDASVTPSVISPSDAEALVRLTGSIDGAVAAFRAGRFEGLDDSSLSDAFGAAKALTLDVFGITFKTTDHYNQEGGELTALDGTPLDPAELRPLPESITRTGVEDVPTGQILTSNSEEKVAITTASIFTPLAIAYAATRRNSRFGAARRRIFRR